MGWWNTQPAIDAVDDSVLLSEREPREERPDCAFAGCTAGWSRRFKRRARPAFEEGWGCSRRCTRALVESAVWREMDGVDGVEEGSSHQHRIPLGLLLLAQGVVTPEQLQASLAAQKHAGYGRIGHWLVEAAGVSSQQITRGIGMQWQCPVLGVQGFDAKRMALAMPMALRKACGVAPLRVAGGKILYLGFDENVDATAAYALERMSGLTVESGVVPMSEFRDVIAELDECASVSCEELEVAGGEQMVTTICAALYELQPVASKLVRLRRHYWLRIWMERDAFSNNGSLPATGEDVADFLFRFPR